MRGLIDGKSMLILLIASLILTPLGVEAGASHFPSPMVGYAIGGTKFQGIIYKTVDGGITWEVVYELEDARLSCVHFISEDYGYAGGVLWASHSSILVKTTNGGSDWDVSIVTSGNPDYVAYHQIRDIIGIDEQVTYIIDWSDTGENTGRYLGSLKKTSDGGASWQQLVLAGGSSPLLYVAEPRIFVSSCCAWDDPIDPTSVIRRSLNGGAGWATVFDTIYVYGWYDLDFADSSVGYAVGNGRQYLKTIDGGSSWNFHTTDQFGGSVSLYNLKVLNDSTLVAVGADSGRGLFTHSSDGGMTWTKQLFASGILHSIFVFNDTVWTIVGNSSVLCSADGGENWDLYPGVFAAAQNEPEGDPDSDPQHYLLYSNYPNPFNSATIIRYDLPQASEVSLVVYDILGREVARLVDGYMEPGCRKVNWDAGNITSGIYIARLVTQEYSKSIKMLLLK